MNHNRAIDIGFAVVFWLVFANGILAIVLFVLRVIGWILTGEY